MVAHEESDLGDVGGVTGVAQDSRNTLRLVNKSGDVVTYNYMKDYKGNAHKCLMAKAAVDDEEQQASSGKVKVTPRVNPPLFIPSPSSDEFLDAEDNHDENGINDPLFKNMSKVMGSLKGNKPTMFHMLMDMVGKPTKKVHYSVGKRRLKLKALINSV